MNKTIDNIAEKIIGIFKLNQKNTFVFDSYANKEITYADFFSFVINGQSLLQSVTQKPKAKIALILNNSLELMVLYYAALINKNIIIPIDPEKGLVEITEILEESKCNVVICHDYQIVSKLSIEKSVLLDDNIRNEILAINHQHINKLDVFRDLNYEDIYSITFTSGSTGKPKGVMHSFKNFYLTSIAFSSKFNFNSKSVFYHNLPMTYMAGILNLIFLPFLSGSKIIIGERFSISSIMNFWELPAKYNANAFFFIPAIISMLLKLDRGTKGIEYLMKNKITACVATAPLNKKNQGKFEGKYNVKLFESYGLSETLFVSTNSPSHDKTNFGVGKLLEGVKVEFQPDGELLIDVPWQFLGYYNFETNDCFFNSKFISGDIAELVNTEYLQITGRKKDIIIRGGINISPKKIEHIVNEFDIFEEFYILGVEDNTLGEKIVCCFVDETQKFNQDIKKEINKKIVDALGMNYQIDSYFKISSIPKNINGKVDKFELLRKITAR